MSDLSPLRPPTADWLPSLMLLYAVAVGPVTYLALRRAGRLEWAIWTVPILTLVAGVGTFATARSTSESDILFNKISLVRSWELGAEGYARTYVSAFSPREGKYHIEVAGKDRGAGATDNMIWPMFFPFPAATGTPTSEPPSLNVTRGAVTDLTNFALDARALGTFQIDSAAPSATDLGAKLTYSGGTLSGTITNRSRDRLSGASLVVAGEVVRLGELAPGETRQVLVAAGDGPPMGYVDMSALVKQLYPNPSVATPVTNAEIVSRDIMESAFNSNFAFSTRLELSPVSLVAWLERSPVALQARQARSTEIDRALLVATLPFESVGGEEQQVPRGLIERRSLVAGTGRVNASGMMISAGETLLFEYQLPWRPDRFSIDDVGIDVNAGGSPTDAVQASVYDWRAAEWRDVPFQAGTVGLGDPARAVSALGMLRLRLNYKPVGTTTATLTLDRFDLAVRGRGV